MRVLVTRPARAAERTVRMLRARGHEVLVSPVLEVVPTGAPLPAGPFDAVLATSAQAFEALTEAQVRGLRATTLYLVGARTAAAAQACGLGESMVVAADGATLVESLREAGLSSRNVLYLAGSDRKTTLEEACAGLDCHLQVVEVYAARPAARLRPEVVAALEGFRIDAVLHYSRRSAALALELARAACVLPGFSRARHVCLSGDVAKPLSAHGLAAVISPVPNTHALFDALEIG